MARDFDFEEANPDFHERQPFDAVTLQRYVVLTCECTATTTCHTHRCLELDLDAEDLF